jgi:hypothetical protein
MGASQGRSSGISKLIVAAALCAAYIGGVLLLPPVTILRGADGLAGVVLGLYTSSLPARHFLELLIYWRTEKPRFRTPRAMAAWIALNALVLFCGWLAIVVGVIRFTRQSS